MPDVQLVDLQLNDGDDRACVWETPAVRVMRVRLAPGGALPRHAASADVLIVPLTGRVKIETPALTQIAGPGEAISIPIGTEMTVGDAADDAPRFLVIRSLSSPEQS